MCFCYANKPFELTTGELFNILTAPIHYRGLQCYILYKSDEEKLIYILDDQRMSTFTANFHFWVKYSFNLLGAVVALMDRALDL